MEYELGSLIQNVTISSFAAVGLVECFKNFIKTEKTWIYSIIMMPIALVCFYAASCLPVWVIGGILTVGATQLCYQTIVQTFKKIIAKIGTNAVGSAGNIQEDKDE